jgi:hypothetical protein
MNKRKTFHEDFFDYIGSNTLLEYTRRRDLGGIGCFF